MPAAQDKALCPMRPPACAATIGPRTKEALMSVRRRLVHALAGALIVTTIAAPTASARAIFDHPGKPARPSPIVTRATDQGFDADSAAIGAVSASAFLLLTGAGVAALGHRPRVVS
jgi:hypothetical protein